jgi:hypothetical protein
MTSHFKAKKSDNPLYATINKNFVVKYKTPDMKDYAISSANKIGSIINDEQIKIRLFNRVLTDGLFQYTFKIRKRLIIKFHSK